MTTAQRRNRSERVRQAGSYLLLTFPTALATMIMVPLLVAAALSTIFAGLGLLVFPPAMAGIRKWADWHRRRAGRLLGTEAGSRPIPLARGVWARLVQLRDDPAARRDIRWMFIYVLTGIPAGVVAVFCVIAPIVSVVVVPLWWLFPVQSPLQFFGFPIDSWESALAVAVAQIAIAAALAYWALPSIAGVQARLSLDTLAPLTAELLAERVEVLTQTRTNVIDAHGAELRRIERNLHDSTQARLVAIAVQLGMAREALAENPEAVARLLQQAHGGAEEAMVELRDVIRTIYPPILADRGLPGALTALCARSGVPARLDLDDVGAVPAAVQAATYYFVAETLTNAAKYSHARQVSVRLRRSDNQLQIEVTDDGIGGADESRGTGIIGIRRRAAALDGTVRMSSPNGGPTSITVDLPCGS
jgi:signal transduction histidine kinase